MASRKVNGRSSIRPMGSFGKKLKREREMRGIALEEIAQHTKISARMLEAIEEDRFDLLPGGIFSRAFVLQP